MDFKAIQEILRFVNKSDLTEVELEEGDFKLKIKRRDSEAGTPSLGTGAEGQVPGHPAVLPHRGESREAQEQNPGESVPTPAKETPTQATPTSATQQTIVSPMVGTFYRSSSPDKDFFVQVGDKISKGQTLCIIEAMKLFNEIESEVEGRIVKVLVENAQPVEYDQPLFLVELSK